jgi:translation elongation factor EF-G
MIDVIALTQLLSPFLPYLVKLGDKAAEEAAKKVGGDSWEKAKAIWSKLHPKVEAKPAAQEAVADVASTPENEDALGALRQQLKKLIAEDPTLESEIAQLLAQTKPSENAGNINISGDVKGVSAYNITGGSISQGNIS